MHTVNDHLSDVGSKRAVSFMVLEKNGPPIWYFFDHVTLSIYQSQNASVVPGAPLKSHDRGQNSRGTLLLIPNINVER